MGGRGLRLRRQDRNPWVALTARSPANARDHGRVQVTWQIASTAPLATVITSRPATLPGLAHLGQGDLSAAAAPDKSQVRMGTVTRAPSRPGILTPLTR